MQVLINGASRDFPNDHSVRDLVVDLGFADAAVAVEVNKRVVPRKQHETTSLHHGDVVEVVTLVGGG